MTAAFGGSPNPGDTSNESINSFNKRDNVPVTEVKVIDNPNLPGPPQDGPDLITNDDRIPRRKGNPDWIGKQFKEVARESDGTLSKIVLAQKQDGFRTDDEE